MGSPRDHLGRRMESKLGPLGQGRKGHGDNFCGMRASWKWFHWPGFISDTQTRVPWALYLFLFFLLLRGSSQSFLLGGGRSGLSPPGLAKSSPATSFSCSPSSISLGFSGSMNLGRPDPTISSSPSPGSSSPHLPSDPKLHSPPPPPVCQGHRRWGAEAPSFHPSPPLLQAPEGAA